jgi:isocitrate dehydrogenase (NAD+)
MEYRVTLLEGDGIGPSITAATCRVLNAGGAPIIWEKAPAGGKAVEQYGVPMPEKTLASIRKNRLGLKGPLSTPKGRGFKSANVTMRQKLNLYVGLRPVRSLPGIKTKYSNVNLVVLRENTEGLYSGIEHQLPDGTVLTLKISTKNAAERISKWAYEYMRYNGHRLIHCCHKAPVIPMADGAFLNSFQAVGEEYPFIAKSDIYIDNLAMELALDPTRFDVLLLQNLYGDIVSDITAGLVGGLGVVPGANIGDQIAVFEAVHGTAPDIAGKGVANPLAVLNSALLMLHYVGEKKVANKIEKAVFDVLEEAKYLTGDLSKDRSKAVSTEVFADAIIDKL